MIELFNKDQFYQKWESSKNNSSESWWYAGSRGTEQYIVIKIPFNKTIFRVEEEDVKIIDIEKFDFSKNEDLWVNIKRDNVKVDE